MPSEPQDKMGKWKEEDEGKIFFLLSTFLSSLYRFIVFSVVLQFPNEPCTYCTSLITLNSTKDGGARKEKYIRKVNSFYTPAPSLATPSTHPYLCCLMEGHCVLRSGQQ